MGVIHRLETVEIETNDGQPLPPPVRLRDRLFQAISEQYPIR